MFIKICKKVPILFFYFQKEIWLTNNTLGLANKLISQGHI